MNFLTQQPVLVKVHFSEPRISITINVYHDTIAEQWYIFFSIPTGQNKFLVVPDCKNVLLH